MSHTIRHWPTTEEKSRDDERPLRSKPLVASPFEMQSLPWVGAADFAATRQATARFGRSPRSTKVTMAPFGDLTFTFADVQDATAPGQTDLIYRLRRGSEKGWLIVEVLAGLRIIATLVGGRGPRIQRLVSSVERGLLAAILEATLRTTRRTQLTTARRSEWSGAGLARIHVRAESTMLRESVVIDVPPAWIPSVASFADLTAALRRRGLRLRLPVELARTTLTAREWSRAAVGDAVVFDEPLAPATTGPHAPIKARVVLGDRVAACDVEVDGRILLTEGFKARDDQARSPMPPEPAPRITSEMIAAAPIEVVAELGRLNLPAEEVLALDVGSVLALSPMAPATVVLRVGNEVWGTGELVNVEGQLGVRLLAIVPRPVPANADDAVANAILR